MRVWDKLKDGDTCSFVIIFSILSIIFTVLYMVFTGNTNQIYNDIVIEFTSMVSSNKSAEMFLIYFLSFIGIGSYGLYYFFIKAKKTIDDVNNIRHSYLPKFILSMVFVITLFQTLIIFDWKNYLFYALLLYSILLYIKDKDNMLNGIVFFFTNTYTVYSVYNLW